MMLWLLFALGDSIPERDISSRLNIVLINSEANVVTLHGRNIVIIPQNRYIVEIDTE